jgi:hypothetical protein
MKNAIVIWPTSSGNLTPINVGNVVTQNIAKAINHFQEDV